LIRLFFLARLRFFGIGGRRLDLWNVVVVVITIAITSIIIIIAIIELIIIIHGVQ